MATHILVPVDFSEHGRHALPVARDLCDKLQAQVTLIHVLAPGRTRPSVLPGKHEPSPDEVMHSDDERAALKQVSDQEFPGREGVTLQLVSGESAAEAIADQARRMSVDMIVLTTHGRGGLRDRLLGSVAQEVIRHAPCPVLVVPDIPEAAAR